MSDPKTREQALPEEEPVSPAGKETEEAPLAGAASDEAFGPGGEGSDPADPASGPYSGSLFDKPGPARRTRKKKNKRLRALIAGAVSICVLAGAMFALKAILPEKEDPDGTSSASESISVKKSDVNKMLSVEVKTAAAHYKAVSYRETASGAAGASSAEPTVSWMLDGYDKSLMDNYAVSSLASTYAEVTAIREMDTASRTAADFGLDTPKITVTVTDGDGSYTVLVGGESPTADGVYLKLADSDKVYLSSLTFKTAADKMPLDFASTTMVTALTDTTDTTSSGGTADPYFTNGALTRYDRINLGGTIRDEEIRLTYDDKNAMGMSPYKVVSPRKTDANSEKITGTGQGTLLSPLASGLSAEAVYELNPTAAKLKEYGLDKPMSTVYYEVKSTKLTLSIANAPDKGYYAVTVTGKPVIFKVPKTSLAFAEWQGPDLYASLIFIQDIHTVQKIVAEKDGKSYTFEIDVEKDESDADSSSVSVSAVRANGKSVDVDKFKSLYQTIIGLTATEYTKDKKPDGKPQFQLTFVYRDASRQPSVLTFTKLTDRRYWYEVEGAGNILISSEKFNEVMSSVMDYFK